MTEIYTITFTGLDGVDREIERELGDYRAFVDFLEEHGAHTVSVFLNDQMMYPDKETA